MEEKKKNPANNKVYYFLPTICFAEAEEVNISMNHFLLCLSLGQIF